MVFSIIQAGLVGIGFGEVGWPDTRFGDRIVLALSVKQYELKMQIQKPHPRVKMHCLRERGSQRLMLFCQMQDRFR